MAYDTAASAAATAAGAPARPRGHTTSSTAPAGHPASAAPAVDRTTTASSPEGIGDIVLAGHPTPYPHLHTRRAPTVGRLVAAARDAASALARPTLWPRRRGRWQAAPRAARRVAIGRMRVSAVVLEPNGFAAVPAESERRESVLRVARGRVHMVTVAPTREMQAVQELPAGRTRVLGSADGHQVINTGSEPAVVVRVAG